MTLRHLQNLKTFLLAGLLLVGWMFAKVYGTATCVPAPGTAPFPPLLDAYGDSQMTGVWEVLGNRCHLEPFNLWATLLFLAAVIHTFLTQRFRHWARKVEERHRKSLEGKGLSNVGFPDNANSGHTCAAARVLHFLGEVEVVFGIWVLPLFVLMALKLGWQPALDYLSHRVSYNEPLFVVVIMAIASTKPVLRLAENCLRFVSRLGGGGPGAWWAAILTLGPLLGSFITEPAAMTISALLLARQFYVLQPRPPFAYATLGLLFVNVSVGGVLTHFAAPAVLMVAAAWNWTTPFMFLHFGWVALLGIGAANAGYYLVFRKDMARLAAAKKAGPSAALDENRKEMVPAWVTLGHLAFMAWTVLNALHPVLMLGGFLFFLAFFEVTADYQSELQMRPPILVGVFLAGLVVHGGLQQWWIAPVLGRLREIPLMFGAIGLTAFNDNAAITYLSTLVPDMTDAMKHAVVAGAVAGGGLTVIANAPNPAGQAILSRHFPDGISPLALLLGALPATVVLTLCFLLFH